MHVILNVHHDLDEALVQSQLAVNLCSAADLARNAGKVLAPPDKNFER